MRKIYIDHLSASNIERTVTEISPALVPIKEVKIGRIISDGTLEGTRVLDSEGNWITNVKSISYKMSVDSIGPTIVAELVDVQLEYMPSLTWTGKEAVYVFGDASPIFFRKYKIPTWLMKIYNFFHLLRRKNTAIIEQRVTGEVLKEQEARNDVGLLDKQGWLFKAITQKEKE
jgi:hypothetical protein